MTTVADSIGWWAQAEPERIALVHGDQRIGFRALDARIDRAADLIEAQGVRPGEVVALLMKNSAAFLELAHGVVRIGAVLLPINYRLAADEVAYIVDHAGARLLFVDAEFAGVAAGLPIATVVVDEVAQTDSGRLAAAAPARVLAAPAGPRRRPPHPARPDDLYRLMYTSGTTDRPKGVMHSHANAMWKNLDHIAALGLTREDRLLIVGPLYHVGAFDLPGVAVWVAGGCLVVLRDFEPEATLATIDRERITGAWMAPVMLNRCLALPTRDRHDLSSLRWLIGGGERTPEQRIIEFGSLFPAGRYIDAYGLTETCSGDTLMDAGREIERIGSTGRAVAHVEITIRDDAGRALPAGEPGEICLRGPKVTRGYWKDPARTAASFFDDWFRSGDIGLLDADGFLSLTDRKKDMIISGGENIASSEVERVLYDLPQVAEAAAIGLADERWGERVTAVVVLRPGAALTLAELRAHCEGRLGGFKIPRQLVVRDALPRNPSGKVLKRVLRDELMRAAPGAGQP